MTKTTIITLTILITIFFASCSNPITPLVNIEDAQRSEESEATKITEKETVVKEPAVPAVETPVVEEPEAEKPAAPVVEEPEAEKPADESGNWWDDFDWENAWEEIKDTVEEIVEENGNGNGKNGNGNGNGRDNNNGNHYGWDK